MKDLNNYSPETTNSYHSLICSWLQSEFLRDPGAKKRKFIKNSTIGAVSGAAGGLIGATLMSLAADSESTIAFVSTIGQYMGGAVLLPLHIRDNPDLYRTYDGGFRIIDFGRDFLKYGGGMLIYHLCFFSGRTGFNYLFQREGFSVAEASLFSDAVVGTIHIVASYLTARGTGMIRDESSIEDLVMHETESSSINYDD